MSVHTSEVPNSHSLVLIASSPWKDNTCSSINILYSPETFILYEVFKLMDELKVNCNGTSISKDNPFLSSSWAFLYVTSYLNWNPVFMMFELRYAYFLSNLNWFLWIFYLLFQLCSAKGFICEICRKNDDIIFPYELARVTICKSELDFLNVCVI